MCLSKTVWASLGDSSTSCKETISIASHCFYSWFLANSLSHCSINCTELKASLSITSSQNNTTNHHLHFLLFWWQSACEEKEHSGLYFAIVFLPTCWGTGGDLASAASRGSLPVVSLEPSLHSMYLNWSPLQWTDIPTQILIAAENVTEWPTKTLFCEEVISKSTGEGGRFSWGFPQAVIHFDTRPDSIKGLYDNLALE